MNLPTQGTEDEVHNKKSSDEDKGDKVNPGPGVSQGVIHLDCDKKGEGGERERMKQKKMKKNKKMKTFDVRNNRKNTFLARARKT